MAARDDTTQYGSVTKWVHWLLLLLIVIQFGLVFSFGAFPEHSSGARTLVMLHMSTGLLILLAGVIFIAWRLANPRPSLERIEPWQRKLAKVVHIVLFAAVIVQPLLGIGMAMAGGHSVSFLGLFSIPPLLPKSEGVGHALHAVHHWVAWVILTALAIHVVGALYHHFVVRDRILSRIMPGGSPGR